MVLAGVASLGLSACSIPMALSQASATLGGSQYLQVHFKVAFTGSGANAVQEEKVLKGLTFNLNEESTNGAPLSHALNKVNTSLVVWNGPQRLMTIVDHKSNLYVNVNVNVNVPAIGRLSNAKLPGQELTAVNLIVGNRWIEFPFDVISQYAKESTHLSLKRSTFASAEILVTNALVAALASGQTTTVAHGFTEAGTLASLVKTLEAIVPAAGATTLPTATAKGTYTVAVTMAGPQATSASASITAPNPPNGNATLTVAATFVHQGVRVSTPTYPLVITPALIKQVMSISAGSNGGGILSVVGGGGGGAG
jgi:hypothetical protein